MNDTDELEKLIERQVEIEATTFCPHKLDCSKCNELCDGMKEYKMNQQKMKQIESKTQRRWIISDTHFFHTNIINYCNRPYKDVKKMNYDLIQKWNSVVGPTDMVYLLGDFALMHGEKNNVAQIMNMLHGRKVLIMGNHDTRKPSYYMSLGFMQATWKPIVIDTNVILSHEPPKYVSKDYIYLFGHVHDKHCKQDDLKNCKCVCCERQNYTPVDLDKLIHTMKKENNLLNIKLIDEEWSK